MLQQLVVTRQLAVLWLGAGAFLLAQVAIVWWFHCVGRTIASYEEKLGRLSGALDLLTETTESSFRAVAAELERLSAAAAARPKARASTRRVAAAAKRGRTVRDIAAKEQLSEGEVRLHLQMAQASASDQVHDRAPRHPRYGESPLAAMRD